jgi:DNA-binding response OmpR family regulator
VRHFPLVTEVDRRMSVALQQSQDLCYLSHPSRPSQQTAVLAVPSMAMALRLLRELSDPRLLWITCFDPATLLVSVADCEVDTVVVHARLAGDHLASLVWGLRQRVVGTVVVVGGRSQDRLAGQTYGADALLESELPSSTELAPWLPGAPGEQEPSERSSWGPLLLDRRRRRAFWMTREIALTSQQFRLLWTLAEAEGALVTVAELSDRVYDGNVGDDRQRLMGHVRRIRRLIEADPAHPAFLLTVRGEGFRLADPDQLADRTRAQAARSPRLLGQVQPLELAAAGPVWPLVGAPHGPRRQGSVETDLS